jgi:lysine 6-dehydrogenase
MLVLGAGQQGSACAYDLLQTDAAQVTLADCRFDHLPRFLEPAGARRLSLERVDVRDEGAMLALMRRHDAVMCAIPYYFNYPMARLAIEAGVHFADLGGNTGIVRQQETLHARAVERGVSVLPDCGLAPGMANVLAAEAIRRLGRAVRVKLYVGGLPQHPRPPLNYQVVYSLEGVLDYYTTPSWVLRGGKPVQVDALSEVEEVEFPEPLGRLEAFHTGGGISTMPWHYEGRVGTMEYKTLRYPGHANLMRAMRELGLLDLEPVDVCGASVRPRDVFIAVVDPKLRHAEERDLVALLVTAEGAAAGPAGAAATNRVAFRLVDRFDAEHGISAMMRTTGFSLSITAQMQVDGRVRERGVRPAYLAVPFEAYVTELAKRGIRIETMEG